MSKTIKIIDLLNKIANGELKRGTKIIYKHMTFIYDYPNLEGIYLAGCKKSRDNNIYSFINTQDIKFSSVEIIEEQEEIDIQDIEEFQEDIIEQATDDGNIKCLARKCNELVQAVKQLDNKLKEMK